MAHQQVYKHSGSLGSAAWLVPLGGIISAIIFSFLYAYILVYNPIAGTISFLITGGFAIGLIVSIRILSGVGKCRNRGFLHAMGALIGFVALYASWVVFIYALIGQGDGEVGVTLTELFISPQSVWNTLVAINADGWFSIKSWTPSGVVLWIFWGIEALIIVGGPLILAASGIDDKVFCERCDKWCESDQTIQLELPEDTGVNDAAAKGDIDTLCNLPRVAGHVYPRYDVNLQICESCPQTAAYQLSITQIEVDKDGDSSEKSEALTERFMLHSDEVKKIRDLASAPIKELETTEDDPDGDDENDPPEEAVG